MRDDERALADIERNLTAADPAFAARMAGSPARPFPTVTVLCVLLYVSAPLIRLLLGMVVLAVTAAVVLVLVAVVLTRRRLHTGDR